MDFSIIQTKKECYICKEKNNLQLHHILFGKNRKKCDEDKLMVWICYNHHEGTNGVHGKKGHELDLELKRLAQKRWQEYYSKTTDEFRQRYGRSYL